MYNVLMAGYVENIEEFKKLQRETGISPNFIHGTYLVNLGTQDPEHLKRGIDWLRYAMSMAKGSVDCVLAPRFVRCAASG